ncbi:MAG TPA: CSLREA domain-containing protein, partial [Nitrolancea sp.]|nr:CSLREA domain-containing protein [Nitrolancea sp.]
MEPLISLRRSTQVSHGGHPVQLRSAVSFLIAMVLTLTPLTSLTLLSVAAAPAVPTLVINAPTQANPGDPIVITLAIQNSNDVAGFESSVLFDTTAAEFGNWQVANNSVHSIGRDVSELAAPETPYGAAIGFYSCPVSNCTDNRSPRHVHGAAGTVQLGTLTLIGDEAGTLAVTFDAIKAVDSSGNTITLSVPTTNVNVQIGSATSSPQATTSSTGEAQTASAGGHFPFFPSPPGRWKLKNAGKGKAGPFSTTGTGDVANADVTQVAMAWENLRATGNPCGPGVDPTLDVNHDGCIDVSDIQGVAANYGPTNTSRIETPASDVSTRAATTQAATAQATTQATSSTFVVNSTGDEDDINKGDGVCLTSAGTCTLRAAIGEANNDPG